jgi:hypothetical protein
VWTLQIHCPSWGCQNVEIHEDTFFKIQCSRSASGGPPFPPPPVRPLSVY